MLTRTLIGAFAVAAAASAVPVFAAGPTVTEQQARWIARFEKDRLLDGYGAEPRGLARLDMKVSEREFRTLAKREGWTRIPRSIKFRFAREPSGPAMTAAAARQVRIFPQSDRALGLTLMAALGGRIVNRGGCLYVTGRGRPDRLAYFPREFGLATDAHGALVIRSRIDGKTIGRIGDDYSWGGPIALPKDAPMVAELTRQCGNAPVEHVGILTPRN